MSGSSWLIGSITLTDPVTIVVDAVNNAVIPAGTYYLRDTVASRSLIDVIMAAVTPFMTAPAIFVARDRKLRVNAGAGFTWTIPTELQDALGFGAGIPLTTAATASDVSILLWSPAWPATTIGHPTGVTGWTRSTRVHLTSTSALSQAVVIRGTDATTTNLLWHFVKRERAWAEGLDDGAPGDYRRFFLEVLDPGHRWRLYDQILEDEASSDPVAWTTGLGPYIAMGLRNDWWTRSIAATDTFTEITLSGMVSSEVA